MLVWLRLGKMPVIIRLKHLNPIRGIIKQIIPLGEDSADYIKIIMVNPLA
jgi:hypothetical protein